MNIEKYGRKIIAVWGSNYTVEGCTVGAQIGSPKSDPVTEIKAMWGRDRERVAAFYIYHGPVLRRVINPAHVAEIIFENPDPHRDQVTVEFGGCLVAVSYSGGDKIWTLDPEKRRRQALADAQRLIAVEADRLAQILITTRG